MEEARIGGGERREKVGGDEGGQSLAGSEEERWGFERAAAHLQHAGPAAALAPCLQAELHPLSLSLV